MAYNITIQTKGLSAKTVEDILIWCHRHLCLEKDWSHSVEYERNTRTPNCFMFIPIVIWMNEESDLLAMRLALGLWNLTTIHT